MKVMFDATWIGSHLNQNAMHGGLRVIYELANRLQISDQIDLFYSINHYDPRLLNNLKIYLNENYGIDSCKKIVNGQGEIFELKYFLNSKYNYFIKSFLKLKNSSVQLNHFNTQKLRNIDIYHSPMEAIPDEIKKNKKIKKVFTSHDLMPFLRPDLAPVSFFNVLKPAYDSIDEETKVICVSNFTKNELLSYRNDLNEEQVEVVYLGADSKLFYPNKNVNQFIVVKDKYNFSFDNYLLCLNRKQKYKNTEHVIEAYINLIELENLDNLGLILIGTFESNEAKKNMLNKYKAYKNICFLEYIPDNELSVFYSNALCFLYMSLYEGFGLPVVEAMQCGVPIIASNQASLPEVISNGGICLDPYDVNLLSDTISRIVNNSDLQKEMSEKSLVRSAFFSWEKNVNETITIYKNIID
jgi:glycosyltransferase involved in cell wall biosynthesis